VWSVPSGVLAKSLGWFASTGGHGETVWRSTRPVPLLLVLSYFKDLDDRFGRVMGGHLVDEWDLFAADRKGTRKVFDPSGYASIFKPVRG
jgi:hypothetical protein